MTIKDYADFSNVITSEDDIMTLVIGWKTGKNLKLRRVELGNSVDKELRSSLNLALQDLANREPEEWTADADLTPETVLVVPVNNEYIGESPTLGREHTGSFLSTLAEAHLLERLDPSKIPAGEASLYALTLGEPGATMVFVRRSNPQRGFRSGRLLGVLGDKLIKVTKPVFAFDDKVDLVYTGDQLFVLSQTVFATLFRDQQHLAAKIPEWANAISEHVSIAQESKAFLLDRVNKDTRLKTRLEAIATRNHLEDVSTEKLRSAMKACGLDDEELIDDQGRLVFDNEAVPTVLKFLNEDLFTGTLTDSPFTANKKAAR